MQKILYKPVKNSLFANIIMAFPAIEEFALSSIGYLWLYKIADEFDGINAERASTDKLPNVDINSVSAISFSMSFDFDYTGVFEILKQYNLPFGAKDRSEISPLIFAGGPVITTNPEPYKDFFDFFVIGDGEEVFPEILEIFKQKLSKSETLNQLSKLDGIYIPNVHKTVTNLKCKLNNVIYTPILSDKSYFKDTFIIEVSRGCYNCCKFCTASYLNLPYRTYNYEKIIQVIELGLSNTNKIALLGAQVSAHPDFLKIIDYIQKKVNSGKEILLSISSLRADSITPELINLLVKCGQNTSTIAIEAATERLRKVINKNLSNEQLFNAIKICKENGLKGIKIYAMLGLPTETQKDIEEFINLANYIKKENKGFKIEFSFSTFVPKPQTPFQWVKREDSESLERKIKYLKKEFAKSGISAKFSSPKWDYWQTVLSRSGNEISDLLVEIYKNGSNLGAYKSAFKNQIKCTNFKPVNGFSNQEILPWDFIKSTVSKEKLLKKKDCK